MHIGMVTLRVADLAAELSFYQEALGLIVQRREGDIAFLGAGGPDLLALIHFPQGYQVRAAGLFHFALLLPSRADLARFLRHLAATRVPLQGLSDHIVSEAIYLADPEGNGIEVYADRPREAWYRGGKFQLDTLPLDVDDLMESLRGAEGAWNGMPPGTRMGHIHLRVTSVPATEAFYRDRLGFDVMATMPSATFLSVDGYHHHVGANTWAGRLPAAPPNALGLDRYALEWDDATRLNAIRERLQAANYAIEDAAAGWQVRDPSGICIVMRAAQS